MLTEKGKAEAAIMGTIIVMLEDGADLKTIAEELGVPRMEAVQRIARIATSLEKFMEYD
jgi:hypothetical protein